MANMSGVTRSDLKSCVTMLKRYFKSVKYPFVFDENKWNNNVVGIRNTNCYRYAFDMMWPDDDDRRIMAFLGWSYGKLHEHVSGEAGFSRFEIDLKRMGFKFAQTSDEVTVPEKGYKIALFIYDEDFHFMRQDICGRWSQKNGFGANVERVTDEDGNPTVPSKVTQTSEHVYRIYHIWQ